MKNLKEKALHEQLMSTMIKEIARLADAMEKQNKINESLLIIEKKKFQLKNASL